MSATLVASTLVGCGQTADSSAKNETVEVTNETYAANDTKSVSSVNKNIPKYIFLFIGDGMSYPQVQSASYYLGAAASNGGVETKELSFMNFPVVGSAQTFDSTSFCQDSASTATSISTGNKTYSGVINMDTSKTIKFETISEKLKEQLGYKIGVLTSVNLNHATPAAFYAHQASRKNYYEIGQEMIASGFDYFAGGGLLDPTGKGEDLPSLYDVAKEAGYTVTTTKSEIAAVTKDTGKVIAIDENLADGDAMSYNMDLQNGQWNLADYVEKGIEVLDNEKGFFMMVEGGKVDWACHANDAAASINDTLALDAAVQEAYKFYEKHPSETLILVTGDHETGGLTIGFAGTNYDTYLKNLENQTISYAKFDSDYVKAYKENKTPFSQVLVDIKNNFGLVTADAAAAAADPTLVLTDYEVEKLKTAYERTLEVGTSSQSKMTQEEYVLYGTYEPLTVTITHILNNKSGIAFTSYSHTGLPVPVFAIGNGSSLFEGYYDNTDIFKKMASLTGVK
ncbi:MAG: alkaline phosphatase [Lachnospiraceae bacterium]|nr:alkaline phosphatase [Lachnospiraceae bacterium]